jgi:tetratricopeptide (TPR) repeat protein
MGELILCRVPLAGTPYYIDSAGINIYSLEELSFIALYHTELLNEDLLSGDFDDWVGRELKLNSLKRELDDMLAEGTAFHIFIGRVLRESGYLTDHELKTCMDRLALMENKSEAEIRKIRGDRMFKTGRYSDAIIEYTSILEDRKKLKISNITEGDLFFNLGASYARMFFFEEALVCFRTAYEKTRKDVALRSLLLTCLISEDEKAFSDETERFLVTPDIVDEVRKAYNISLAQNEIVSFEDKIEKACNENPSSLMAVAGIWKSEYEKNSGM